MKLNAEAQAVIETWRLGFVATVTEDGRPNVSPKATFLVLDDETIAFGEMRSPQTMANLARQPEVEVNFVDILSRKGVRIRGAARVVGPGEEYNLLAPGFEAVWGDLVAEFKAIVVIPCDEVRPLRSPAYEFGATEKELRAQWLANVQRAAG